MHHHRHHSSAPAAHKDEASVVAHYAKLFGVIGSPAFPTAPQVLRERVLQGMQRNFHPEGTSRQMVAIAADTTRAAELAQVNSPTLVLHGMADPLVPFACGEDTTRRIPGAVDRLLAYVLQFFTTLRIA